MDAFRAPSRILRLNEWSAWKTITRPITPFVDGAARRLRRLRSAPCPSNPSTGATIHVHCLTLGARRVAPLCRPRGLIELGAVLPCRFQGRHDLHHVGRGGEAGARLAPAFFPSQARMVAVLELLHAKGRWHVRKAGLDGLFSTPRPSVHAFPKRVGKSAEKIAGLAVAMAFQAGLLGTNGSQHADDAIS